MTLLVTYRPQKNIQQPRRVGESYLMTINATRKRPAVLPKRSVAVALVEEPHIFTGRAQRERELARQLLYLWQANSLNT